MKSSFVYYLIFALLTHCHQVSSQHLHVDSVTRRITYDTVSNQNDNRISERQEGITGFNNRLYARLGLSLFTVSNNPAAKIWVMPGFTLTPGLRLAQSKAVLLTVSLPVTVGWFRNSYFGMDLPLMMDISLGSATGNSPDQRLGFITGGGMGLLYSFDSYTDIHVWGYRAHAGVSFGKDQVLGRTLILATFGKSVTGSAGIVLGLSLQIIMPNDQQVD